MGSDLSSILRLEVPVIVRLGERMLSMDEVLDLVPGAIIELAKNAEDPLDLMVNNKQIGFGSAVKVGENFGIRIEHIGDVRDRIQAMSPGVSRGPDVDAAQTEISESPASGTTAEVRPAKV